MRHYFRLHKVNNVEGKGYGWGSGSHQGFCEIYDAGDGSGNKFGKGSGMGFLFGKGDELVKINLTGEIKC